MVEMVKVLHPRGGGKKADVGHASGAVGVDRFISGNVIILKRVDHALDELELIGHQELKSQYATQWRQLAKDSEGREAFLDGGVHLYPQKVQDDLKLVHGANAICKGMGKITTAFVELNKDGFAKQGMLCLTGVQKELGTLRTNENCQNQWKSGKHLPCYIREVMATLKVVYETAAQSSTGNGCNVRALQDQCSLESCEKIAPGNITARLPRTHSAYQVGTTARQDQLQDYWAPVRVQQRRVADVEHL